MLTKLGNFMQNRGVTTTSPVRSFQVGQIFHGKIDKLYPNQLALVQVGAHKLIAKLEVGLTLGSQYWFKVESLEGKPHLKVIEMNSQMNDDEKGNLVELLRQMRLPVTKGNTEILKMMMKEDIPLTSANVNSAIELLGGKGNSQEGLLTFKEMLMNNMPMTKDIFHGILSVIRNEPLTELFSNLYTELRNQPSTKTGEQLEGLMKQFIIPMGQRFMENVVGRLFSLWLNPIGANDSELSFHVLQKLGLMSGEGETKALEHVLSLLSANMENEGDVGNVNSKDDISLLKKYLHANLDTSKFQRNPVLNQVLPLLKDQFYTFSNGKVHIATDLLNTLSYDEQQLLQKQMDLSLEDLPNWGKGKETSIMWRNLYEQLGLSYEKSILEGTLNEDKKGEMLKSLLLQLLKEDIPQGLKDAGQSLLSRITGLQLLSQENAGYLHQYVMQIPIPLWDKMADLTIQWQGRKKENGEIDSNYCRVLFYLDMDILHEVVIDMQVQNRVLRLTIYNDTEGIKSISQPFEDNLREQLTKLGFTLSTIHFLPTSRNEHNRKQIQQKSKFQGERYSGVDIRI